MRWSEVGRRSRIYPKQIVSHDAPPKACETHRRSGDRCADEEPAQTPQPPVVSNRDQETLTSSLAVPEAYGEAAC
jgi:hypothetical protein